MLLQFGGRVRISTLKYDMKHPVLLQKEGHITTVIMRYLHEKVAHAAKNVTFNELRSQVNYQLHKCCEINDIKVF